MKIGIISDIHANIYGLKAVLKKMKRADVILCAGDIVGYYTFANEAIEEIKKNNIKCVLGNQDAYLLGAITMSKNPLIKAPLNFTRKIISKNNLEYLRKIKNGSAKIEIDGLKIMICHGSPWDKFEGYIYPDFNNFDKFKKIKSDLVILGHTHRPMIKKIGNLTIINPGSCGQPRDYNNKASCAIFDTKSKKAKIIRVKYDISKVLKALEKQNFDKKLGAMLKTGK